MTAWFKLNPYTRSWRVRLAALLLVLLAAGMAGCSTLSYYWQATRGQLALQSAARPIDEALADPTLDARIKPKLEAARKIRAFAISELGLPDNKSYTAYADLKRPFVVWSVVATPELSLKPMQWCFPVAGCVTYKGWFSKDAADDYAKGLRDEGYDVHVGGVPAYSTLGWFDDPLLNTFIQYPEGEIARLVFHELAHQLLYVQGDSTFNESFATAVEEFGVERWLAAFGTAQMREQYVVFGKRKQDFRALLARFRGLLEDAYKSGTDEEKRARKTALFKQLREEYEVIKRDQWGGFKGYDRWFDQPLSNAHLAAIGTYTQWLPAFRALLAREGNDIGKFYAATRALGQLSKSEREQALIALAPDAAPRKEKTAQFQQ
jgi:predicted aminopeptidase